MYPFCGRPTLADICGAFCGASVLLRTVSVAHDTRRNWPGSDTVQSQYFGDSYAFAASLAIADSFSGGVGRAVTDGDSFRHTG